MKEHYCPECGEKITLPIWDVEFYDTALRVSAEKNGPPHREVRLTVSDSKNHYFKVVYSQ